jgi:hypothetical protein
MFTLSMVLLVLCACTTTEQIIDNSAQQEIQTPQIAMSSSTSQPQQTTANTPNASNIPIWGNPFEIAGMPIPFEHIGGDEDRAFSDRYDIKLETSFVICDEFLGYSQLLEQEFVDIIKEKWAHIEIYWDTLVNNRLMENYNLFSRIILFDVPDEVIIDAIRKSNEHYRNVGGHEDKIFTDFDIATLLTRDEAIITAQFAEETAIVLGDRAFSPAWVYLHTPADYARAGITPAMIQEKLPMWQEFGFTDEARAAFEGKLTEFVGVEVSLAQSAN